MRSSTSHRVATFVVVALLASAVAGAAIAVATTKIVGNLTVTGSVTARDFRFAAPKTAIANLSGAAFHGEDNGSDVVNHDGYSGEVVIDAGSDAVAQVDLPNGAVVTKVEMVYALTAADGDLAMHLEANRPSGDHADMVTLLSDSGCATTPCRASTTSVLPDTINNKTRTYGVWLSNAAASGTVTLYAVKISYTLDRVGPAGRTVDGVRANGGSFGRN